MTKKFGFGLMRLPKTNPDDATSIDIEQVKKMVDLFLEKGFTYFDTAWMYHNFASETAIKAALVERHPRDSFTLATKFHVNYAKKPEDRDEIFNTQRQKTGVDYFDYYLLHSITAENYPKYEELDCFSWILEKKAQGLVKHAGFSFHDGPELLDEVLTKHPEMDFVQLQINYLDWEDRQVRSRACYEVAQKHGKPVVIMEPVKGGTLATVPQDVEKMFKEHEPNMSVPSWAVRFAASLPGVMMVLSGMSSLEQMQDNLSYMEDFKPLTQEEVQLCAKAAEMIRKQIAIPCTACSYCTDGCPKHIAIPQYFALFNEDMREKLDDKAWAANLARYNELGQQFGKAADCISCGHCESVCPQHLPIMEGLKKVAKHYK